MDNIIREALARWRAAEQQVSRISQCFTALNLKRREEWHHSTHESVLLVHFLFPSLGVEALSILARLRTWRETVRAAVGGQLALPFGGDRERVLTEGEAWFVQARQDYLQADIRSQLDPVEAWLVEREFLRIPIPEAVGNSNSDTSLLRRWAANPPSQETLTASTPGDEQSLGASMPRGICREWVGPDVQDQKDSDSPTSECDI